MNELLGIKHLVCPSVCETFEDTLVLINSESVWGLRVGFKVEVMDYIMAMKVLTSTMKCVGVCFLS